MSRIEQKFSSDIDKDKTIGYVISVMFTITGGGEEVWMSPTDGNNARLATSGFPSMRCTTTSQTANGRARVACP